MRTRSSFCVYLSEAVIYREAKSILVSPYIYCEETTDLFFCEAVLTFEASCLLHCIVIRDIFTWLLWKYGVLKEYMGFI